MFTKRKQMKTSGTWNGERKRNKNTTDINSGNSENIWLKKISRMGQMIEELRTFYRSGPNVLEQYRIGRE